MNQNYNLMRLANLYGGMNKYAADDIAVGAPEGTMPGIGDFATMAKELRKLPPAVALRVLEQNPGKFNPADLAALKQIYSAMPDHAGNVVGELAKLAPENRLNVYRHEGKNLSNQLNTGNVNIHAKAYGEPVTLGDKVKYYGNGALDWIKENPWLAGGIGAGALGLGGLGAYALMNNDDEEEERKKSASYIDPYTAQVLAHDYITKMAKANGIPSVAAGVTGVRNYLNY